MILITAHMLPSILERISLSSLTNALACAFQTLRYLEISVPVARNVRRTLKSLHRRVTRSAQLDTDLIAPLTNPVLENIDEPVENPLHSEDTQAPDGDFPTSILEMQDSSWFDASLFDWDAEQWETSSLLAET